jgi:hypothetical protein
MRWTSAAEARDGKVAMTSPPQDFICDCRDCRPPQLSNIGYAGKKVEAGEDCRCYGVGSSGAGGAEPDVALSSCRCRRQIELPRCPSTLPLVVLDQYSGMPAARITAPWCVCVDPTPQPSSAADDRAREAGVAMLKGEGPGSGACMQLMPAFRETSRQLEIHPDSGA